MNKDVDHKNYTILLVEDEENDILLTKRAFREADISNPLRVVKDGEKAIEYLAGEGEFEDRDQYPLPIMILLDLNLPKKDGHDVLKWLKDHPDLRKIPVIVMTSSSEEDDINRAYDRGANSYIVKPVSFEGFKKVVERLKMYWLITNKEPKIDLGEGQ